MTRNLFESNISAVPGEAHGGSIVTERVHSLDAARALFLLLGIPFHVATMSIFGLPSPSEAFSASPLIAVFMSLTHAFRMFGFFMISGYFSALIIRKRGRKVWVLDRIDRLGIPLLCSTATVGALMFYIDSDIIGRPSTYFLGLPILVGHLWFLVVLLMFVATLYLVPLERIANKGFVSRALLLDGRFGIGLLLCLAVWGLFRSAIDRVLPDGTGWGFVSHYIYHAPAFALGALACFATVGTRIFTFANRRHVIAVGITIIVYVCLDTLARPAIGLPDTKSLYEKLLSNSLDLPIGLLLSLVAFSALNRFISKKSAIVDFMVSGAMAIYIFHMVWTKLTVKALTYVDWPAEVQWVVGSIAVLCLSILSYLAVRPSKWLSMAFVGTGVPAKRQLVTA